MQERSLSERARALSPPRLHKTLMSRTYVRARSHLVCARAAGILERIFASLVARGEEHGNARRRADDSLIVLLPRARPSAACMPPTRVVNFNEATPRRRLRLRGIYVCLAVICIPNFRKKQKRKWPAAGLVIAVIRMSDRVEPVTRKGRLVFFFSSANGAADAREAWATPFTEWDHAWGVTHTYLRTGHPAAQLHSGCGPPTLLRPSRGRALFRFAPLPFSLFTFFWSYGNSVLVR